jgi:hypothetical protein
MSTFSHSYNGYSIDETTEATVAGASVFQLNTYGARLRVGRPGHERVVVLRLPRAARSRHFSEYLEGIVTYAKELEYEDYSDKEIIEGVLPRKYVP